MIEFLQLKEQTLRKHGVQLVKLYAEIKKHCDVPSRFFHDGQELSEPKAIANAFNVYFANIGRNLAATIEQDNNADFNHMQYLGTPTKTSFNPIRSGGGGLKALPPPIFCPHAFNFGATILCIRDFSQKIV